MERRVVKMRFGDGKIDWMEDIMEEEEEKEIMKSLRNMEVGEIRKKK